MNFEAKIDLYEDHSIICSALTPEKKEGFKRASWDIEDLKDKARITIKAEDSTAFRAMLSTISKALILYEKSKCQNKKI